MTPMATLNIRGVRVRLGRFELGPIDLQVAEGETIALLGPNGAGKTTLLETVAGFHRPEGGSIWIGHVDLTYQPPEARRLALVLQDYALFPHLTVAENVAFGTRYHRAPPGGVAASLVMLGIQHLAGRRPRSLSGGERQRVALARALAIEPAAFLLDEPLSTLDAATRRDVRAELRDLLARLGATCVVVTHDQSDAFALAQRVALLVDGRLIQVGAPEEVYRHPATAWAARFLGMELLRPERVQLAEGGMVCHILGVPLRVAAIRTEAAILLAFRPEDVRLQPEVADGAEALQVNIDGMEPEGPLVRLRLRFKNDELTSALLSRRRVERLGISLGKSLFFSVAPEDLWPVAGVDGPADQPG